MQEFLMNNTVNCNLMSLTGYRTLIILSALLEAPKSLDEINNCLMGNQYINEKFSRDTLRIYINSLREIGCDITRASKSNGQRYELKRHPFELKLPKSQLKALIKLYKNLHDKLEIENFLNVDNLLQKIAINLVENESKEFLKTASLLKKLDKKMLKDLIIFCRNKNQIKFLYNSPSSGKKEIEIIADKLEFKSEKLYLWGTSITHRQYSYFLVERIVEIINIKIKKEKEEINPTEIIYEIIDDNNDYCLTTEEELIEKKGSKLVVKRQCKNEFESIQYFLALGPICKILAPRSFKENVLSKLKKMEQNYAK